MNSIENIEQQTKKMLVEVLPDVGFEDLNSDSDIFGLGLDSLNAMTLVTHLQNTFNIQLDTAEISFENFQNLATIVQLIESKKRL